jgi:hypothetical protein
MREELTDPEGCVDCPCCGYQTLTERDMYQICSVCFWEDDCADDYRCVGLDPGNDGWSFANRVTLSQARANYALLGACVKEMVKNTRPPQPGEIAIKQARAVAAVDPVDGVTTE